MRASQKGRWLRWTLGLVILGQFFFLAGLAGKVTSIEYGIGDMLQMRDRALVYRKAMMAEYASLGGIQSGWERELGLRHVGEARPERRTLAGVAGDNEALLAMLRRR